MRQVQIETVRALLVHELAGVRRAGLFRAASAQSSTESLVRSIAIADPDGEVRSAAIDLLVEWDLEHGETLSLEVGAIVKRAMRDGDLRTRRETACYVEDLGVEGPRIALDLLIDEGLADDYEPRTDVFDLQRAIIRDHATPTALRAGAIEGLADEWEDEDLERAWPEILAVWKEAAERDPSAVVRATAQSMLKETRE